MPSNNMSMYIIGASKLGEEEKRDEWTCSCSECKEIELVHEGVFWMAILALTCQTNSHNL